jgi:hypothetical protein
MNDFGRTRWAIADGYIPGQSTGPAPQMTSHDSLSFLNTGDKDVHVRNTIYDSDREPVGPYQMTVPARRTKHMRFNQLERPEPIPWDTEYSALVESDVPVVVQQTRLDSRQAENALFSTMAYSA